MFKEPLKSCAERQTCSRDGVICICSPSRFQTLSVLHSFWCFKVAASEGAQTAVGWSKYSIIQKVSSLPLSPSLCVCASCSLTACGVCGCWWYSSCHHWNICLHWDRVALSFYIKSTPHTNTSRHTHTHHHTHKFHHVKFLVVMPVMGWPARKLNCIPAHKSRCMHTHFHILTRAI